MRLVRFAATVIILIAFAATVYRAFVPASSSKPESDTLSYNSYPTSTRQPTVGTRTNQNAEIGDRSKTLRKSTGPGTTSGVLFNPRSMMVGRKNKFVDKREYPTPWPFRSPPDEAVITLKSILNEGKPILLVSHDKEDGGWQFLDGSAEPREEDAMVVSLHLMTRHDPSILELADLPEGWQAWRQSSASEWVRRPE